MAWLENPMGHPVVAHKDHNRKNNTVNNLCWATHKENLLMSAVDGRLNYKKPKGFGNGAKNSSAKIVVFAGVEYETIKDLQKAHPELTGINFEFAVLSGIVKYAKRKRGQYKNAKPFVVDGVVYRTLAECSFATGTPCSTISKRLKNGVYFYLKDL
jgi:hypothetical protein